MQKPLFERKGDEMTEKTVLENGLTVVFEKIEYVRSVSFGIYVKNGSRNENGANNGISHFIEHELFKGTQKRSAKDIAEEMDEIGGQLNAYTTKEYTCYYAKVLDTQTENAIDIIADMFFNSRFDDCDIEKERKVITEEINMYEDSPEDLVYEILQNEIWKENSLGMPILGTVNTIANINGKNIKEYVKENYRADNTVIAVCGCYDRDEMLGYIEKYFGRFKGGNAKKTENKPVIYRKAIVKQEKDIEQLHLCMVSPGVKLGTDENYTLSVINNVFGASMSSMLFQKIREEHGLAYSVYSFGNSFSDTGLFGIYAGLGAEQINDVYSLIYECIEEIKKNGISEKQLRKSREQIKSNYIMGLESTSSRMGMMGRGQLLLGRVLEDDAVLKKIDMVDKERTDKMIKEIFDTDKMSISVVGKNVGKIDIF